MKVKRLNVVKEIDEKDLKTYLRLGYKEYSGAAPAPAPEPVTETEPEVAVEPEVEPEAEPEAEAEPKKATKKPKGAE